MKEIKFRAWNKTDKVMRNMLCYSNISGCALLSIDNGNEKSSSWFRKDEIELMQYTGLHDKNGKEIYEGDIVKQSFEISRWDAWDECILDLNGTDIGEVTIIPSKGACIKNPICCREENGEVTETNVKHKMFKNIVSSRCEVIGNIHQNPELLKEDANE